jgi:hypothetical protein
MVVSVDEFSEIPIDARTDRSRYLVIAFAPFFPLYLDIVRRAYSIDRQISAHPRTTKVIYGRTLIDTGFDIRASIHMPGWDTLVHRHQHPQDPVGGMRALASHLVDMSGHANLVVLDYVRQSVEIYDPSHCTRIMRLYKGARGVVMSLRAPLVPSRSRSRNGSLLRGLSRVSGTPQRISHS